MNQETAPFTFAAGRRRSRRSLVPLAGLLGVVLVTTALIGLFELHLAHQGYSQDLRKVEGLIHRLDLARRANIHFKRQVQEWKNVLLRGHDGAARTLYLDSFLNEERAVVEALAGLAALDDDEDLTRLREQYGHLGARYREALALYDDRPESLEAVEKVAAGIDRPVDAAMDHLGEHVLAEVLAVREALARGAAERYARLRDVGLAGLVLCLVLVCAFLLAAMRHERQA
ncbi:MAG: hypothetical protein HQL41_06920 [Alphaproteobacteria bacterium]|nr:hypothetical protein [Alphaproteobacteria bacterium]